MTAFAAGVHKDIPPYFMAAGYRATPAGLNKEGMRRNGFTPEQIKNVERAYKILYRQDLPFETAKQQILQEAANADELKIFIPFFEQSTRGIIR